MMYSYKIPETYSRIVLYSAKLVFLATAGIYNDVDKEIMQVIFDGNKKFTFEIAVNAFAITGEFQAEFLFLEKY